MPASKQQTPLVKVIEPHVPKVELRRLKGIVTYEVMASDLDRLEEAAGDEKNASTFCTMFLGAVMGAVIGWPAPGTDPTRYAIQVALTAVFAIAALWFGIVWWRKRASHKRIAAEIRRDSVVVASE